MTLMTAGKKICNLLRISPDSIIELKFVDRKSHALTYGSIRGLIVKTKKKFVIVMDIKNLESMFIYETTDLPFIVKDMNEHRITQAEIGDILEMSQGRISRLYRKGLQLYGK